MVEMNLITSQGGSLKIESFVAQAAQGMHRSREKHTTGIRAALTLAPAILIAACVTGTTQTRLSTLKCSDPTLKTKAAARFSEALKTIVKSPIRNLELSFSGVTADNIDARCNADDKLVSLEIGKNAKVTAKGSYTGACDPIEQKETLVLLSGHGFSYVWKNPFEFAMPLRRRFDFSTDGNVLLKTKFFPFAEMQIAAQSTPTLRRCKIENEANGRVAKKEILRQVMQDVSNAIFDDLRNSETACDSGQPSKVYAMLTEALTKKTESNAVVLPADEDANYYHRDKQQTLTGKLKVQFSQKDISLSCNSRGKVQSIRLKQPIQMSFSGGDVQHCSGALTTWSSLPFTMDIYVQLDIHRNDDGAELDKFAEREDWFDSWDFAVTGKMAEHQDCIDTENKGYWMIHRFDKLKAWMVKFLGGRLAEKLKDYA